MLDFDLDVHCKIARSRRVGDAGGADLSLAWPDNGHERQEPPILYILLVLIIKACASGTVRTRRVRLMIRAAHGGDYSEAGG
jgi:hypothetical protein